MKSLRPFFRLFAVLTLSVLSVRAADEFEGKVNMNMTVGKQVMPVTYYIKGPRTRSEVVMTMDKKGNTMTMIALADWRVNSMSILMPQQKMYMVYDIPDTTTDKAEKTIADFKATGRTEKIAGYEAEEYAGISEGKRTEMWLGHGIGKFMMGSNARPGRRPQAAAWEKFMREGNFFPLRIIVRAKEGAAEEMRMEVTTVEKSKQPDSLFVPPADFQKMEMPNMGGVLKGLIPGSH